MRTKVDNRGQHLFNEDVNLEFRGRGRGMRINSNKDVNLGGNQN